MNTRIFLSFVFLLNIFQVSAQKKNGILFDDAVQIDSSEWFLIPEKIGLADIESYGKGKGFVPGGDYKEVMIYNAQTNMSKNLFQGKKVIISNFQPTSRIYHNSDPIPDVTNILKGQVLLLVRSENLNKDNGLDSDDPVYMYIVNKNGEGLSQITPSGMHVRTWKYYSSRNMVMARIQKDSDNNGKFDHRDDEFFYKIVLQPDISQIKAVQITQ